MTRQVVGLFDSMRDAEAAVRDLQNIGIGNTDISFVGSRARGEYDETGAYIARASGADATESTEGAASGATGGAVLGGLAGVLLGLGALAIPGIGPVLAAGPFAAAIGTTGAAVGAGVVGAAAGAATGGLLGALVGAGIPEDDAHLYAEGIRRGGTLVSARVDESQVDAAMNIMDRHNVVDLDQRRTDWQAGGWTRFDENAAPYEVGTARQMGGPTVGAHTPWSTTGRARRYPYETTQHEGVIERNASRAGNVVERAVNADLDRDGDVGVRDPRNNI
jgi:hypothetical protein